MKKDKVRLHPQLLLPPLLFSHDLSGHRPLWRYSHTLSPSSQQRWTLRTSSWWVLTSQCHDTWNNNDYVTLKSRLKNLVSWQDTSCQIIFLIDNSKPSGRPGGFHRWIGVGSWASRLTNQPSRGYWQSHTQRPAYRDDWFWFNFQTLCPLWRRVLSSSSIAVSGSLTAALLRKFHGVGVANQICVYRKLWSIIMTSRNINNSQRFIVKTRYPTTSLAAYSVCGKPGSAEKKKQKWRRSRRRKRKRY